MPLYEYQCRECDQQFEVLQRMGEGTTGLACPHCGAMGVDKQFSTFSGTVSGEVSFQTGASGCCGGAPS